MGYWYVNFLVLIELEELAYKGGVCSGYSALERSLAGRGGQSCDRAEVGGLQEGAG